MDKNRPCRCDGIDSIARAVIGNRLFEMPKNRYFELVDDKFRKHPDVDIILPTRGTKHAMAYDFYSPVDIVIEPGQVAKIWSDVKAKMGFDECLILNIRSSMGGIFMLSSVLGWIDSDYHSNENNDGNIGLFLMNISDYPATISKGERIAQGAFFKFLEADNGNTDNLRSGGFGSTNRETDRICYNGTPGADMYGRGGFTVPSATRIDDNIIDKSVADMMPDFNKIALKVGTSTERAMAGYSEMIYNGFNEPVHCIEESLESYLNEKIHEEISSSIIGITYGHGM